MEFFVARAMQIGCLDESQLLALHARERELGHCIHNSQIQRMFGLTTIKDLMLIPEDDASQERHSARVKRDLLTTKIAKNEVVTLYRDNHESKDFNLPPWECLNISNPELVHAFDCRVLDGVKDGNISLVYSGGSPAKGSLKDRAKASRVFS